MPAIQINLGDIETFESLPFGSYYGELEALKYRPAREAGKFPQLQALYTVIDGDQLGRKQSEFISLSPKALFRFKAWLMKFGIGNDDEIVVDDESPEEPLNVDLIGSRLIFAVFQDPKDASRIRTELQTVEETTYQGAVPQAQAAPAPVAKPRAVAAPVVAAAPAEEAEEEVEEEEAEEPVAEAVAAAPAPRKVAARPAAAPAARPAAAPVRRTLR